MISHVIKTLFKVPYMLFSEFKYIADINPERSTVRISKNVWVGHDGVELGARSSKPRAPGYHFLATIAR